MASIQNLKLRIRSVKKTKQITKAMELVAVSKMRRAQDLTRMSLPYTTTAREILTKLSQHALSKEHPLFKVRDVKSRLLIVIASDKGLAGAYNVNILKAYAQQLRLDVKDGVATKTITVGKKALRFATRIKDTDVIGSYQDLPDKPEGHEIRAILGTAHDLFINGEVDAVDILYTQFFSSSKQEIAVQRLLPAGFEPFESNLEMQNAVYEPGVDKVLDAVAYRLVEARIFQALLDSKASEHSMRMVAMKNATDNAGDLVDDLTLAMNKSRQGMITQELAEISGGAEAING